MYLICKRDTQGQSVYKWDTNWMDVLQLLCFMVCEWIKGTLSLCVAWRMILYFWSCAAEWWGVFSWWKTLGFHAINPVQIYHADSLNLPCVRILYKLTFDITNQLATGIIYTKAWSPSRLIVGVWLHSNHLLGQVGA